MVYEDKLYGERVRRFIAKIEDILYDAYRRLDAGRAEDELAPLMPEEVNIYSWPQAWPDWGCGFEGDWRQEPCVEQTCIVVDERTGVVLVYHAGRFVREIEHPTDAFWSAVRSHDLPAARQTDAWETLAPTSID
ncbi:MAG: hypothetical protein P8Z36_03930 [Gemmatimonadota bacterium]|jgi:hypothetical protein